MVVKANLRDSQILHNMQSFEGCCGNISHLARVLLDKAIAKPVIILKPAPIAMHSLFHAPDLLRGPDFGGVDEPFLADEHVGHDGARVEFRRVALADAISNFSLFAFRPESLGHQRS